MKIKVCGISDSLSARAVAMLEPDMMGFIFYKVSKRYVSASVVREVLKHVPETVQKVGVFVNEPIQTVVEAISFFGLDAVQLHGDELPEYCRRIRDNAPVIKAFGVKPGFDFKRCHSYELVTDYFLFDTATSAFGGSGKAFDHTILEHYQSDKPFMLSGGIDLITARSIWKQPPHTQCAGIDVNSRFEKPDLTKDISLLKQLVALRDDKHVSH